ncbi:4'-phosphopantetheinyl transferase superfamily protein [Paenibacillus sp. MZ03-122A]|uniref:4'-phosphopantetheinyl transferase family protein n=1 Tax=Paenibacillus sp. MZ03-122A TaxID=2962033 RepID=UPI00349F5882
MTLINYSNQELNIILWMDPNGKPYLVDSEWKFNVSHSGNWVALAVDIGSIGIDVERMSPIDLDIANRHFSSYEYSDLMSISPECRLEYFFRLWTLKEAYIK